MQIITKQITELIPSEEYLLSFPLKPDVYGLLWQQLAFLPMIVINQLNHIIFGIDFYYWLNQQGVVEIQVVEMEISRKDGLILNYHLKNKLTGLNLYEKLVFLKKVLPLIDRSELYKKTQMDIKIDQELINHLDLLISTLFRDLLVNERITLKTGLKLCNFSADDLDPLLELFNMVVFSNSHQLKIVEMIEEILFREKCPLKEVFEKLNLYQYLELEKPQKKIIEEIFKYRYPKLHEAEISWQRELKKIKLPNNIQISHSPNFEKQQIQLSIQVDNIKNLKKIIEKLNST